MNFKIIFSVLFSMFSLGTLSAQEKISSSLPWSVRMVRSEILRNPKAWQLDFQKGLKWDYCHGLELGAILDTYKQYGDTTLLNYVKDYGDAFVHSDGSIETYKLSEQSLDRINTGKILFDLYNYTKEERYKKALDSLRSQLNTQPRTTEGGFWHKKVYPHQMWLDGIYMASPFYAEYAFRNNEESDYADVIRQFLIVDEHTYDAKTGLNRHAWDESKEQQWADKNTGQSAHCWGRAYGWYAMALVDVLAYIPTNEPGREKLIKILNRVVSQLERYQDFVSGEWYQVMDSPDEAGNYLEASCSAMFIYTLAKAVRLNYIPATYMKVAKKGYEGYLKHFIVVDKNGLVSVTHVCAVAGLGGTPYRSGTYSYYINEKQRDNDAKAVGPFIMASLFMEQENKVLAFPGADGFGKYTTGGRAGKVILVTNLNDDGEGSLRKALEKKYPRIIVFKTSGTIWLKRTLFINKGDVTIVGESAPGFGITIAGYPVKVKSDNIIMRYLRFRLGDINKVEDDALDGREYKDIIIDHCSVSWSTDECCSFYGNKNFTLQWCLISESLKNSIHHKGPHGYGAIWGGDKASFLHNLLADHDSRNPRFDHPGISHTAGVVDFRNNVIYNWGMNATYGGDARTVNLVGNYYKPGPATLKNRSRFFQPYMPFGKFYVTGNVLEGSKKVTANNWLGVKPKDAFSEDTIRLDAPLPVGAVQTQSAEEAYRDVLEKCGASKQRDAIDQRVIEEVRTGVNKYGTNGIIDSQTQVGGFIKFPEVKSTDVDIDNDGMPDVWEKAHGLNSHDASDAAGHQLDIGYTNIEVYLYQ